jgi:hypothetical protein
MTEVQLTDDGSADDPGDFRFYVERATTLIYDARFFDEFVIVRPASPAFYLSIRKLSHSEFIREFEEYAGDQQQVAAFLLGGGEPVIIS